MVVGGLKKAKAFAKVSHLSSLPAFDAVDGENSGQMDFLLAEDILAAAGQRWRQEHEEHQPGAPDLHLQVFRWRRSKVRWEASVPGRHGL